MKIVRIIARLNIGGPARNVVLLTEGIRETVLVCGDVGKGEGDMAYLAREKGIEPVIVKELGRELSWKDDWTAFWKIYRIIQREKPDIIHTHTAKAGALGRLAGILYAKAVLIHTFEGHVLHSYFGKIKTMFFIWVERILALFTCRIIAVSGALKKELAVKYKIAPESKFSVVELGFELDELFKLSPREDSEVINIGIVGRLVPIKNHKMLFDAVKKVLDSVKYASSEIEKHILPCSNDIRVVIIGDGELREELEKYAKELGIKDIIEFRGWVKDLKAIYEELDIVALTSLNEGAPVSIIEAMAGAKPVVATGVGGVPDIVKDGQSGYLAGSGDIEEFSRKLMDLIGDPEKRKRFGEYGRNIVKNRFSKERLIKDTEKLYNNILKQKGICS